VKSLILFVAPWLSACPLFGQEPEPNLLAWIHDGATSPLPTEASIDVTLAWHLAQLTPATHLESNPLGAGVHPDAIRVVLDAWRQDTIPLEWQDAAYARLRGNIDKSAAGHIASLLADPNAPRHTDLLNLLLEAPFDQSREVLIDFVLDESNAAADRGRVAEYLLLLGGRPALDSILPSITPDSDAPYLRRLFSAWRTFINAADLPLLEQLATEADGYVAQFALQLWAINERDSSARMRIYQLARGAESSFRSASMSALARGGTDPEITAALIAELNSGGRNARSMARRFIPQFSDEQTLLTIYKERAASMSPSQAMQWMPEIASLSLPEASRVAMQWLIDGGWSTGAPARSVVRYLARSSEVDPLLATLLSIDDLPKYIRFPLGLARGPISEDARAYLRSALPELMPSEQSQVFYVLAANGELDDLLLIRDFVFDSAKPTSSRVEGMRALASVPAARELMGQWRDPLPQEYQILATLVELLLMSEEAEWRRWALETAMTPPMSFDEDEARGLRTVAWRVLGQRRAPGDSQLLANAIAQQLPQIASRTPSGEPWATLFRFESEFPELAMLLASFVRCNRVNHSARLDLPSDFDSTSVAADALVVAAAYLAESTPETAGEWFADLAARPLHPQDSVRVAGLTAHRLPYGPASDAALDQLLATPETLFESPRLIAQSFAPVGVGWVLFHDRLAEQLLVSKVLQQQRPLADLELLLQGWVEDDILATAAEYALGLGTEQSTSLALRLQQRRAVHLPLDADIHAAISALAEQLGDLELAAAETAIKRRLLPQDSTDSR